MNFRALVTVPFVALALVGCSSSGGGKASATVPAGATLIKAIEGISWDAKSYTATAVGGKVSLALEDDSSLPHNLHLLNADGVDQGIALDVQGKGDVHSADVALAPGNYQVICTIAGHGNMKATLTVN
jgi:plastocyanin